MDLINSAIQFVPHSKHTSLPLWKTIS